MRCNRIQKSLAAKEPLTTEEKAHQEQCAECRAFAIDQTRISQWAEILSTSPNRSHDAVHRVSRRKIGYGLLRPVAVSTVGLAILIAIFSLQSRETVQPQRTILRDTEVAAIDEKTDEKTDELWDDLALASLATSPETLDLDDEMMSDSSWLALAVAFETEPVRLEMVPANLFTDADSDRR